MPSVHLLNCGAGDCTIIQHGSGRVTMVDICGGNTPRERAATAIERRLRVARVKGNFRMCEQQTQPLDYLGRLGVSSVFRFILTHPDMDHMDGLAELMRCVTLGNYWDSGVRKEKPDFGANGPYVEADWDAYERLCAGGVSGVTSLQKNRGDIFPLANKEQVAGEGHDWLYILAPGPARAVEASGSGDANDGSYVLLYRSGGGRIVLPGDAGDNTWDEVLKHYKNDVKGCAFLLAPHHGRDSGMDFSFLDTLQPSLTLFGCAPSDHLAYDKWRSRGLAYITANQAGDVCLEIGKGYIEVFVQNENFCAEYSSSDVSRINSLGYYFLGTIKDSA